MNAVPRAGKAKDRVVATAAREFRTHDLDQARAAVGHEFYPIQIEPTGSPGPFSLTMRSVSFGSLTLGSLTYGTDIKKDCGELQTAFHVNIPVRGEVLSSCEDQQVVADPRTAAVFNPTGRTVLDRWSARATQLCLKIDRSALEQELSLRLDRPLGRLLKFRLAMDMTTPAGRNWHHAVLMLAGELDAPGGFMTQPLLAQEVQRLIVSGLLWSQQHTYSADLRSPASAPRPRTVKLAMDLIESEPERAWAVADLAELTGISVRSIEDGFRRYVGISPVAYLRRCRLDRAHNQLQTAAPNSLTVADVAHRWGFTHLGRFSRAYHEKFDQYPSETLRS